MRNSPRPPSPEDLSGLGKFARKQVIKGSGLLERRRFLITPDPELKERIHILRRVINNLRVTYPEIIGVTLFGSSVKGYGTGNSSDIDMNIFLDEDKIRAKSAKDSLNTSVLALPLYLRIHDEIDAAYTSAGLLRPEKMEEFERILSRAEIVKILQSGSCNENIITLFDLAIGKDIREFRELVISTLETMGNKGEKLWREIMFDLFFLESGFMGQEHAEIRRHLYPKTLADGRKYFLEHKPWRPEKS